MTNVKFSNGFTIVELMVSIGILAILFALTTISLSSLPSNSAQSAALDVLLGDIRSQQTQAMSNDASYGIHFETASYTLFTGSSYSVNDPSDFVVTMNPGVTFTNVTFSGNAMVFSPGTGDLGSSGSFTFSNTQTGKNKTVNINIHGATY